MCGACNIKENLQRLSDAITTPTVTWKKWKKVTMGMVTRAGKTTTINKIKLVTEQGPLISLVQELEDELHPLAGHLFNWAWQHAQYKSINDNPPGHIIMVLDFTENYACLSQNEVQAGRWTHDQATIHPFVAKYACPARRHTCYTFSGLFFK